MSDLKNFKTRCATVNDESICIRQLKKEDICAVAQLYANVAITDKNYKIKLSPESACSFEKKGGMFLINTKKSLEELFYSDKELMLIAEDEEQGICGFIWYSMDKANIKSFSTLKLKQDCQNYGAVIRRRFKDRSLVFGKEIIVAPDRKIKQLPLLLFYSILIFLYEQKYTYSTGEVYQVKGYEDNSQKHITDMLNIRSYKTLSNSGGIHIGSLAAQTIQLKGFCVDIESHVFLWDIHQSILSMKKQLKGFNIKIEEICGQDNQPCMERKSI